jgi:hypothetical protein
MLFFAEVSKVWPPCIRIIVKETNIEQLKVGTLFIVTCTGGTMGREGDHAVSIPDINISKVSIYFSCYNQPACIVTDEVL